MKKIIAGLGKALLTIGMLLYLGKHSLSFFQFTFSGDDQIYAWLGLLTTSGGVLIWLSAFLWLAESALQKTIALVMVVISLLGEFGVAGFDMWMNASGLTAQGAHFTDQEIKNMTLVVAGLALLNGAALVADVAGDLIEQVWNETHKPVGGVIDLRLPHADQGLPIAEKMLPAPVDKAFDPAAWFRNWFVQNDENKRQYEAAVSGAQLPAENAGAAGDDDAEKKAEAARQAEILRRTTPSWNEIKRIDALRAAAARGEIELAENDPRLVHHFWGTELEREDKPAGNDARFPERKAAG